ncbi:hypothetical protein CLIB1423_14S03554 [[Candida] railenensis]|uniref:Uncharacterized protein n=1 Tax=[Candida] railenensis TaxID=45579 RepID=A0A9P0W035_9ASCO|nr:hypothetical protein CLIB1423_14S03554 [[Candida] railenensis]
MWILEYPRNDKIIKKWLHPNNSYQIGRINDPSEHEVHLNELYISKRHLIISIGSISLQDVTNAGLHTPLKITFQSKARTSVNGEVFQLNKTDPQPIEVAHFTQESELNFKFKSGTPLRMKLSWVPFNIGRLRANMKEDETVQKDILKDSLLQLFNSNVDIRIIQDFSLVTHVITPSDEKFWFGLGIALARGVPIVGMDWPKYVLSNIKYFEKWLYSSAIISASLLPTTSRNDIKYFVPNSKRSSLLSGVIVYSISVGDKSDYFKLLSKWITALSGEVIDVSNLRDTTQILAEINNTKGASKIFIMESNKPTLEESTLSNHICQELQTFVPINPSLLYDSVVNVNIDNLKIKRAARASELELPNEVSIKSESISPQKRRLGSRKSKKVDRLAFFDFSSMPISQSQGQSSSQVEPPIPVEESIQPLPESEVTEQHVVDMNSSQAQSSSAEDSSPKGIEKKRRLEEEEVENLRKKSKTTDNQGEGSQITKKHSLMDDIEVSDIQQEKRQKVIVPKVTLKDAIFQTKSKATDAIRKELGIGSQDVHEGLTNLAIVESVDIPLRSRKEQQPQQQQQQPGSNMAWHDRKDFKKFKKNIALKSRVSRSFVEMELVDTDARAPGSAPRRNVSISQTMEELLRQEQLNKKKVVNLAKDFDGAMEDINGFNPGNGDDNDNDSFSFRNDSTNQSLFVSEDSQTNEENSGRVNTNNRKVDYESDDDSDDDQPKFGFSKRY